MVVWPLRPVRRRPQPARLARRCQAWLEALEERVCLSLPAQFSSATDYPLGPAVGGESPQGPASLAAGDLTGTGRTDLVAVTPTTPQVTLLQNNGDGTFTPLTPISLSSSGEEVVPQPDGVIVADLNGDGRLDIAVADYANDTLVVLLNTTPAGATSPTFAAPQIVLLDLPPRALVAANLVDGDTRPDLVVAEPLLDEVAVAINQTVPGSSTVDFAVNFYELPQPVAVAVGPFTGSPHQDIAVAGGSTSQVAVLPGNGDGTFGTPLFGDVQGPVTAVVPYSDPATGLQGFAAASQGGTVTLFGQGATNPLTPRTAFAVGSDLQALATADVNGDGVTDIVAADAYGYSAVTATGPFGGSRGLPPERAYFVGALPTDVVAVDVNGDGAPDLAVANAGSGTVSVLLNLGGTRTTLTSTPGGPQAYQPIAFTATVRSTVAGQGTPTGTVTFVDGAGTTLGSAALVNGVATFTDPFGLPPGVSQVTAIYGGNQQGVPGLFPSRATETLLVAQPSPPPGTPGTPAPTTPVAPRPAILTVGVVPFDGDPTSRGRNAPGTNSGVGDQADLADGGTTVVTASTVVARDPLSGGGGGGPPSDGRVGGPSLMAAWSDAEAPVRSEFGPAFDSVQVASVTAVVAPLGEKAQGQPRPGPRAARGAAQGLFVQQGRPADKASALVASTFDGDDSVALFEAVARGWATPAAPVVSTAPAGDDPGSTSSTGGSAADALLAAGISAPAPAGGARPVARGAVYSSPLSRFSAFAGAVALAVTGLWFGRARLRHRTAHVPPRRPESD
jgi:hypothetical protein